MPTILKTGPYRFWFFSNEGSEPPHVHVSREKFRAKFWLNPVSLAFNFGFAGWEVNRIESIVREHRSAFIEAWNAYFGIDN